MKEILEDLDSILSRVHRGKKLIGYENIKDQITSLEVDSQKSEFWNDQEKAASVMTKIASLKKDLGLWDEIESRTKDLQELSKISEESDHEIFNEIRQGIEELKGDLDRAEFVLLLSGPYDQSNAVVSVYAGSGGVDAQDWAQMLLTMILKFCEKRDFKTNVLHIASGDEAGIKSATVEVVGFYAFGYLKSEKGVHRLVRLSPYDSDKARHTSFALIDVMPEIEAEDFKVDENDVRVDTFRASGHGGQGVNTTDSAVRVTHIPTGISVTCQKERSQLQNKAYAMKILASRLKLKEDAERLDKISEIRGETVSAEWGNQIRSYVLHPYNMVKDHRTGHETSNTEAVLNGELDEFIESYLRENVAKKDEPS